MSDKADKSSKAHRLPLPVAVPKWPFLLCDALFLSLAVWLGMQVHSPIEPWQVGCIFAALTFGAFFAAAPFSWEYRAEAKAVEIAQLTSVAKEVNKMEDVARQIAECSGTWLDAQEASEKSVSAAKEIAQQVGEDAKDFSTTMAKLNSSRLKSLELEVEKLRRAEQEWSIIVMSQLDLVYRLRESAVLSGKEPFGETMMSFQGQCRDLARRIGLTPFEAEKDEPFDSELHQLADQDAQTGKDAKIAATNLPGYKLQGQLVRKVVVTLKG